VAAHSRAAVPPGDVRHEPPGLVVQRRLRRQAQPSSISLSELSGADVYHQIPPTAEASFCKSSDSWSLRPQMSGSLLSGAWTYRLVSPYPDPVPTPLVPRSTSGRDGGWTMLVMALVTAWVWR